MKSCRFEVFGRVQGVLFRRHAQKEAQRLGLVGTVRNTQRGTVEGVIQGSAESVDAMKVWLRETGSPKSRIDGAAFSEEKEIDTPFFHEFQIIR